MLEGQNSDLREKADSATNELRTVKPELDNLRSKFEFFLLYFKFYMKVKISTYAFHHFLTIGFYLA